MLKSRSSSRVFKKVSPSGSSSCPPFFIFIKSFLLLPPPLCLIPFQTLSASCEPQMTPRTRRAGHLRLTLHLHSRDKSMFFTTNFGIRGRVEVDALA